MLAKMLSRALPRGIRPPGPAQTDAVNALGNWWGPTYNQLPWSNDGSANPVVTNTWGEEESAAMAIPSAWRATNMIAGVVAQMPLVAREKQAQTPEFAAFAPPSDSMVDHQVLTNPWPMITYYNWMFMCVASLVLRGNFYAIKFDYDPVTGWPRQLIPIHVDDIMIELRDGYPWYYIDFMNRWLPYSEVFHIRGFMMPGMLEGVGVIEVHRRGLWQVRELMDYGAGAYASGGVPPVVMTVDKPELTEAEAQYLQSRWVQRHGNLRDRRPAVVPKIVTVDQVGLSMQDAEYLESRKFSISEIAYMFNLDPSDLDASFTNATGTMRYENSEDRMKELLVFSMNMWINRVEEAFTFMTPGSQVVKFKTDELLRTDTKSRFQTYEIGLRNRVWTINEVRAMEGYPPIEGGDDLAINNTFGGAWDRDADPTTKEDQLAGTKT